MKYRFPLHRPRPGSRDLLGVCFSFTRPRVSAGRAFTCPVVRVRGAVTTGVDGDV